jgi:hypothetical protein
VPQLQRTRWSKVSPFLERYLVPSQPLMCGCCQASKEESDDQHKRVPARPPLNAQSRLKPRRRRRRCRFRSKTKPDRGGEARPCFGHATCQLRPKGRLQRSAKRAPAARWRVGITGETLLLLLASFCFECCCAPGQRAFLATACASVRLRLLPTSRLNGDNLPERMR